MVQTRKLSTAEMNAAAEKLNARVSSCGNAYSVKERNTMVRVTVPATSANMGSGYDSIGIALELYNVIDHRRERSY